MTAMVEEPGLERTSSRSRVLLDRERRLRRGWRVLAYLVLVMMVTAGLAALGRGSLGANLAAHAAVAGAVVGLTYVFRRYVDRRAWRDIGLAGPRWRDAATGFATGIAAIVAYLAVMRGLGWSRVTGTEVTERGVAGTFGLLGAGLFMYATSAVFQEIAFRGYVLQTLADGWSMRGAAVVSSMIFAVLHFSGVPTPLFALVLMADVTLMACFFVLTRLSTGALWMAIGFHSAWNWTQDCVFSLDTDAGSDYGNSLVHVRLHTPQMLLGPNGGAELLYLFTSASLFGGYWLVTRQRRARTSAGTT